MLSSERRRGSFRAGPNEKDDGERKRTEEDERR